MPFIEIFLIILGAVVVGIILSLAIIYLIKRIERPRYPPSRYIIPSPQTSSAPPKTNSTSTAPKNGSKGDKLEELLKNHKRVEPSPLVKQAPVVALSSSPRPWPAASPTMSQAATAVQQAKPVAKQPLVGASPPIAVKQALVTASSAVKELPVVEPSATPRSPVVVPEPIAEKPKVQLPRSDVYKELESNLSIATAPWTGKVTAFQTAAWDTSHDNIEPELDRKHGEITEVYIDIRLANNIVWISNELGNKSPNLDESYRKLCAKIAERIGKVVTPVNGNR